jgi:hypothetical protein
MVHDSVRPSSSLRPLTCTIPMSRDHLPFLLCFPHHSYLSHQSLFPFPFSPLPICTSKNHHHKSALKPPRMTILDTMPTKKTKLRTLANNRIRTIPPSTLTLLTIKSPPKILLVDKTQCVSRLEYSLAMSLTSFPPPGNAPYPPVGVHLSEKTILVSCACRSSVVISPGQSSGHGWSSCPSRPTHITAVLPCG